MDSERSVEEKRAYVSSLLRKRLDHALPADALSPIARVARDRAIPLSFAQERLWFLDQFEPGSAFYNLTSAYRLKGRLHVEALEHAFKEIVRRHEALRTTFGVVDGKPVQVIQAPDLRLAVVQVTSEDQTRRITNEEQKTPFDLSRGPLFRVRLLRFSEEDHVLLMTMHHVVSDGWSYPIIFREIEALYEAYRNGIPSPLADLSIQYADFAHWQRQWFQGEVMARQIAYWRQQLAGAPAFLELPMDRPRPAVQTHRGSRFAFTIPRKLADQVWEFARREGATPSMVFLAAFDVILGRHSGQEKIVVGTPTANRTRVEIEPLIGFFVNVLALATDLSGAPTFKELVSRVRETSLGAYSHQDLPFERLVDELRPERNPSHSPIFQVMFVLQTSQRGARAFSLPGLEAKRLAIEAEVAKFDLTLEISEREDGLRASFEYNTDLFDRSTIERMAGHFSSLLGAALACPDARVTSLSILSETELKQLADWNDTRRQDYPLEKPLHELIDEQVRRTADRVAVVFDEQSLTYGELDRRSNQLARALTKHHVRCGDLVAVYMERSVELVVALIAVLKAGAAYVPIDPEYPRDRIEFMLSDVKPTALISQRRLIQTLPSRTDVLCVDDDGGGELASQSAEPLGVRVVPNGLAYGIFTSGSTGRPKCALNTHVGIVNRLVWMQEEYGLEPSDRVLQKTPYSFDVSVWEFFWPLLVGARLVIAEPGGHRDPAYLVRLIVDQGVTTLHFVPSMLQVFLAEPRVAQATSIKRVICSGEALPVDLTQRFFEVQESELHNLYGPTEAAVDVTYWACQRGSTDRTVPIGRPVANTQMHVLDSHLECVPIGVAGEVYIGGIQLAQGYLGRPGLTADRFVVDPFPVRAGNRLYRTGDLGRVRPDGAIEYLGRIDHQVKVRGFRIELGEIEAALCEQTSVREAVVVVREDAPGNKQLVAYLVPKGQSPNVDGIRSSLKTKLPDYMVPTAFVVLDAMPLSPNGKVDRKALPAPELPAAEKFDEPSTSTEEALASIWSNVLRVASVGRDQNFFELGGHSLLAIQVVSRIRKSFGVELPVRAVFEEPTLAGLAGRIDAGLKGEQDASPPIVPVPRDRELPLSFAQERLWFLDQLEPGSASYNIPSAYRLTGPLAVVALEKTFAELVRRHEALRTTFGVNDGKPVQVIRPAADLRLAVVPVASEEEAGRLVEEEARTPFDLTLGPLFRARLLRLSDDDHILVLNTHHAVSDGWSTPIFFREIESLYDAFSQGNPSPLPELPIQYADFAHWQRSWFKGEVMERQIAYWRRHLEGAPALLELPTDRPRPPVETHRGSQVAFTVPKVLSDRVREMSRREGATPFMVLLAAFNALLARYTGQGKVVVGTPTASRTRIEIEPLIGFFVNTLAVATDVSGEPSFKELVARVREAALGAFVHQDLPFEKLVDALNPQRNMSYSPVFQVMFILQTRQRGARAFELRELEVRRLPNNGTVAKFDLTLSMFEREDGLRGTFEYNTDLFNQSTIQRMSGHLETVLAAALDKPDASIGALPLLTGPEHELIVKHWNDTGKDMGADWCVHDLIEQQVERTPETVAVTFGDSALTYSELNARANQVARRIGELGVGPDSLVGICVERSLEMVVGLIGILKAGAAYVPIDPEYPRDRIEFMLSDVSPAVVLTQCRLVSTLPAHPGHVLCLDDPDGEATKPSRANLGVQVPPSALAYGIFTSGSTGKPKCALNTHAGIVNLVRWMQQTYPLVSDDCVLQKTPFSFDVSTTEFFWPLAVGARLAIAQPGGHRDPDYLVRTMIEEAVTTVDFVPSMLQAFAAEEGLERCTSLRRIIAAGEALPPDVQDRCLARLGAELHNLYGPTEAAVYATYWECHRGDRTVPIGRPLGNMQTYILDRRGGPVPAGVAGELYIGGVGLARGYLRRPELTAEKFVRDGLGCGLGARLYRTGDLTRFRADGTIEYLGRIDHQVKVRGFRIELGEIEAALCEQTSVREAVVVAREDTPGNKQLVAYLVPGGQSPDIDAIRSSLRTKLPDYMVPSAFVALDALPLNPNGKVDRKALPAPSAAPEQGDSLVAPRDALELQVASIWEDVLRLPSISVTSNFFELGGHSLLAVRLVSRLKQHFQFSLPVATVFSAPTVRQMSDVLRDQRLTQSHRQMVPLRIIGSTRPLFIVHSITAEVFSLVPLAKALSTDLPVYAFQSRGLESQEDPLESLEDMARAYIAELRTIQPRGPYRLSGHSLGGVIAFEMAQQLQRQGEQIELLALFDSFLDEAHDRREAEDPDRIGRIVSFVGAGPAKHYVDQLVPEARERYLGVVRANARALLRYRAARYPGAVLLVRARDGRADPREDWAAHCPALEVIVVPGTHSSMLEAENVRELAAQLGGRLSALDAVALTPR
jgi:amino acid adenylation domain-containing protein